MCRGNFGKSGAVGSQTAKSMLQAAKVNPQPHHRQLSVKGVKANVAVAKSVAYPNALQCRPYLPVNSQHMSHLVAYQSGEVVP